MKSVCRFLSVLVVMGYMCSGAVAYAATYYVATNGSDGSSCSQAQSQSSPKRTLNAAVACLRAGDTLYVRGGVYGESLLMNVPSGTSWDNKVRIAAYNGETVTMRPSSGWFVLQFAGSENNGNSGSQQYIEFDGINLDGTDVTYDVVKIDAGPGVNAHHIRIKNATLTAIPQYPGHPNSQVVLITGLTPDAIGFNEFQHLTLTGGGPVEVGNDFSSMFYIQTPDNLIEDSIIENGVGAGVEIYNSNSPGSQPHRTTIRNNIIRNFTTSVETRANGIIAGGGNDHQIYNNTIHNIANLAGQSGGIYLYNTRNSEVYNNTVYGNGRFGIVVESYSSGAIVRNNISYGNQVNNYADFASDTLESNNLFTDPHFVDAGGGDFRLRSDSPAIDRGAYLATVGFDQLGVARPQGDGYDIGAYEFDSGGAAPSPPPSPAPTPGGASPDGTRIPGASVITDSALAAWTLGSGQRILRNGVQAAGAAGSQILWAQGSIFVLGDDGNWWKWTGVTWVFYSSSDPSPSSTPTPAPAPAPTPAPTPTPAPPGGASPDGARIPGSSAITDSSQAVWTLGSGQRILRNGVQPAGAFGSQILWYQGSIFVLGDDDNWWRWTGVTWVFYSSRDPN
jgi:parallel beta-helix repeat protein